MLGSMPESAFTHATAREFQQLMREECGVELSVEAAWTRATQLTALYRMLMGPIPEDPGIQTSCRLPSTAVDKSEVVE